MVPKHASIKVPITSKTAHTTQAKVSSKNKTYFQLSGWAMGAPFSGILSEVFLQNLEHTKIIDILT
jgi:hypothetical protein